MELEFPRSAGYRPSPEVIPFTSPQWIVDATLNALSLQENPLNAWYYKSRIEGRPEGVLAGKTLAIKDNVFVAGVPLMNGSRALEGFVPTEDATIVTRILRAGIHSSCDSPRCDFDCAALARCKTRTAVGEWASWPIGSGCA